MIIAIGNRVGRTSGVSSWNPQSISAKVLFWGKISEVSGGQMPNKVGSDYLTVSGSAGSYTFQCPNTAPYIAADTDYIWFKSDESQRTTTEAELVGFDFSRTLVKYLNVAPYTIDEIWILKAGVTLGTDEDKVRDYMQLSYWWDNTLSLVGTWKQNRPIIGQYIWTPELLISEIIADSDTECCYDVTNEANVVKVGSEVSKVEDLGPNNNDLVKSGGSATWSAGVLKLNKVNTIMQSSNFGSSYPISVYMRIKQVSWESSYWLFNGGDSNHLLEQSGTTPNLNYKLFSVTMLSNNNLVVGEWHNLVLKLVGGHSYIQIDNGTKTEVEITAGLAKLFFQWCDIELKKVMVRGLNTSDDEDLTIKNWLSL